SRLVGSDPLQQFNQLTGTVSAYQPLGGAVLAARLRVGAVLGSSFSEAGARFVPARERLCAGGRGTVAGFRQNELGPVAYIASGYDERTVVVDGAPRRVFRTAPESGFARVVPLGGNSVVVANLELRMRSPVFT